MLELRVLRARSVRDTCALIACKIYTNFIHFTLVFNALASRLGGTSRLAIQGVTYPANVIGFLAGGDAAGATTMFNLINQAASRCPSTKIVVSGYSQGAQLVHTATQRLTAANAARVNAGE
jgi:cutinase